MRRQMAMMMALVLPVAAAGILITVRLASAAGRNEPILGQVNSDRYPDRIYLGTVAPDSCSVIVEYGRAAGGFDPPVAYTYLRPGIYPGGDVPCPDIGTAVELDPGRPNDELVVAWFAGPPATVTYNLLVLRAFRPAFGLTQAIFQPSFQDTADFNGDGRLDVYSVTDQGQGFETYLSLGNGTLTPGPVRWCSGPLTHHLHDFDHDGARDVLIAYTQDCGDFANGVVVVLDDGTARHLEHDPDGYDRWNARVLYANDDRHGDVRTQSLLTGAVSHFLSDGAGNFVEAPRANPDTVYPTSAGKTIIDVLANDYATPAARLTVTTSPRTGTVQILSDRRIAYTPASANPTTDRFAYQLTEDGRQSTTSVYVRYR